MYGTMKVLKNHGGLTHLSQLHGFLFIILKGLSHVRVTLVTISQLINIPDRAVIGLILNGGVIFENIRQIKR